MRSGTCPKCRSTEIIRDVRVIDRADGNMDIGNLTLGVYSKPKAWVFKGKVTTELSACVCAQCGFTEMYAANPQSLVEAAAAAQEDGFR